MAKHDVLIGWITDYLAADLKAKGLRFKFCFFDAGSGLPVHRVI